MCAPSPPAAPDPTAAAVAQGAANKETAIANAQLNNPNVTNPGGTQTVTYKNDPVTGNPVPYVTQTYAPGQQQIFDNNQKLQQNLGLLGIGASDYAKGILDKPLDFNGTLGTQAQGSQKVIDAMMARYDADLGRQQDQSNSDNVAKGIPVGSKAWEAQQDLLARGRNDALQQSTIAADNTARTNRQQAITEILAQRQTPLNEISALRSGSQINPLTFAGVTPSTAAPAPIFQANQQATQNGMNQYNANAAQSNATMGGLFSLAGAAAPFLLGASDRRLKSSIRRICTHPLGIGVYAYDIFGKRSVGVMAQELLTVKPGAVHVHPSGYLMVDYGSL